MDGLTRWSQEFQRALSSREACREVDCRGVCAECEIGEIINRLFEYEATGLTPEEIIELKSIKVWCDAVEHELDKIMELEKAERLVVLPCKVTDAVYIPECVLQMRKVVEERVVSAHIENVTIDLATGEPLFDLRTENGNLYRSKRSEVFCLTREEAEAALHES